MSSDESLNDLLGARDVFDGGLVRVRRNGLRVRRNGRGIVLVLVGAGVGLASAWVSVSGPVGVRGVLGVADPVGAGGAVVAGGAV